MLNNTNLDFKPYTLTAFHCLDYDGDRILSSNEKSNVQTWNFKFGFMKLECGGPNVNHQTKEYSGATFRAAYDPTDFALLELNQQPKSGENYQFGDVYFNGWDKSNNTPSNVIGLHHPDGDYLKISKDLQAPSITGSTIGLPCNTGNTQGSFFYRVWWDLGTTEGGSSGSPLFDHNHRVVGQLTGGCSCLSSFNNSIYGRMYFSWEGGGTSDTRLKDWLDPNNTGVTTLNGMKLPNLIYGISFEGSIPSNRNAYDQMKVGSDGLGSFNVKVGATLNLKAGREIVIRPCSYIRSGSNFRAYIAAPSCSDIIYFSKKESDYANSCPTNSYPKISMQEIEEKSESIFTSKSLSVFPNPASDKVNISFNLPYTDSRILTISNSFGNEIIKDIKLINMKDVYVLQLSDFSSGVYFVTIKTDVGIFSEKFEIIK